MLDQMALFIFSTVNGASIVLSKLFLQFFQDFLLLSMPFLSCPSQSTCQNNEFKCLCYHLCFLIIRNCCFMFDLQYWILSFPSNFSHAPNYAQNISTDIVLSISLQKFCQLFFIFNWILEIMCSAIYSECFFLSFTALPHSSVHQEIAFLITFPFLYINL